MDAQITAADQRVADFLRELTELSRKHHLAFAGNPVLFEMEPEDFNTEYRDHPDATVTFG